MCFIAAVGMYWFFHVNEQIKDTFLPFLSMLDNKGIHFYTINDENCYNLSFCQSKVQCVKIYT